MDEGGVVFGNQNALRLNQQAGVGWLRSGFMWKIIEPVEGTFNFAVTDTFVNDMMSAGLAPAVFIYENPAWAANTPCGPVDTTNPAKLAAFGTLMSKLAARYPQIKVWALYNEPDNSVYATTGYSSGGCFGNDATNDINGNGVNDRIDYARMLAVAWQAVHQANPAAQLAIGALAYDNFDDFSKPPWYDAVNGTFNYNFLPELLSYMRAHPLSNGQQYADMLMFNYYDGYSLKWQKVSAQIGVMSKADWLQRQMAAYGFGLPMFVGESGISSNVVGEQQQAGCLDMTMIRGFAFGLQGLVWWTFEDVPPKGWYFGVVDEDMVPKPSYYAFQTMAREINGHRFNRTLTNSANFAGVEAYEFKNGNKATVVIWSTGMLTTTNAPCSRPRQERKAIFGPQVTKIRVVEMGGQAAVVNDNARGDNDSRVGYIAIHVAGFPKFVEVNP